MFSPLDTLNPALSQSNGRLKNEEAIIGASFKSVADGNLSFSNAVCANAFKLAALNASNNFSCVIGAKTAADISSSIASADAAAIDDLMLVFGLMLHDKERFMTPPLQFLAVLSDGRSMTPPSQNKYLIRSFPLDGTKLKGFQSPKVDKIFITRMVFP